MSESPRTVFILEDEPATRQQLEHAIEKDPGLTLAASAACLEEAVAWWKAGGRASAALIDLALPDGNGESFIRMIGAAPDAPAILVSTVFGEEKHVVEAIAGGAAGYLLKERAASHIAESIRQHVFALQQPHSTSTTADVVTLSLGIASMTPDSLDQSFQELVNYADQALYKAKAAGRNRIALHGLASVTSKVA